jgi:hypothetical protein
MQKPKLFISHIGEEAKLAEILKTHFLNDFLGMIDVFVSSDNTSITVGNKWLNDIDEALKTAQVELILCSEGSVKRPWINFEAGAGWVKGIPVVPVCHTGMRAVDLPIPLNMLQAIEANDENGLQKIYGLLAKNLGSATPTSNFAKIVAEVKVFEQDYGVIRVVRSAVQSLIKLLPQLEQIFRPLPVSKGAQGRVPELLLDKMLPHFESLQNKRFIDFATGSNDFYFGETSGGNFIELNIQVHDSYYQIAQQVLESH